MRTSRTLRTLLVAAATLVAGVGLQVANPQPAAAAADWTQVQHNIRGHSTDFDPDDPEHAHYVVNWINAVDPIAASVNEVCKQQADYIWNHLNATYHIWYVLALPDVCDGQGYGNVLLVAKSSTFSVYRDNSYSGYTQTPYSTPYTKIFGVNPSGYSPPEKKRVDCALVTGTSAGFSFKVCTAHLNSDPDASSAQVRAIRDNSEMNTPTLFMGDFNKDEDWLYYEIGSWQRDDNSSNPIPTRLSRRIDWVLGRNTDYFALRGAGSPKGLGLGSYVSDHKLLVAFVKAQYN